MNRTEIHQKVEEAINEIRPFLEGDGGNIELVEVTNDKIAKVRFLGACSSCSISPMTLKSVDDSIRSAVPEIKGIVLVENSFA